jgi:hypothetical protein
MAARPEHIRRRAVALGVIVSVVAAAAAWIRNPAERPSTDPAQVASAAPPPPATLPDGTRSILPEHRVYAHYGAPQARALGILGIGTLTEAAERLQRRSRDYAGPQRLPVLPAMELIAVVAAASPGRDGKHRYRQTSETIRRHLQAARSVNGILILDIQPGRADFLSEAKALSEFLIEPDVSLALDPEWRMGPTQVPGRVIGTVDAAEVNAVTKWLSGVVQKRNLPDKLVIIHQFTDGMVRRRAALKSRPGLDIVLNADGFGTAPAKRATYDRVTRGLGPHYAGFKLFYEEDTGLMTPADIFALRPKPFVVIYE